MTNVHRLRSFATPDLLLSEARRTTQRGLVLRSVGQCADAPGLAEIHRRAALADPGISLPTVQRLLKLFVGEGLVRRLQFGRPQPRYALTSRAERRVLGDNAQPSSHPVADAQALVR
jgi:Fe2+ or Zn2+ uptake regulation protein